MCPEQGTGEGGRGGWAFTGIQGSGLNFRVWASGFRVQVWGFKFFVRGSTEPQQLDYPSIGSPANESASKQMRISAVHHVIVGVIPACKWIASIVGVDEVVGKDGTKIDVEVNAEEGELDQEMRLAEPLLWKSEFQLRRRE